MVSTSQIIIFLFPQVARLARLILAPRLVRQNPVLWRAPLKMLGYGVCESTLPQVKLGAGVLPDHMALCVGGVGILVRGCLKLTYEFQWLWFCFLMGCSSLSISFWIYQKGNLPWIIAESVCLCVEGGSRTIYYDFLMILLAEFGEFKWCHPTSPLLKRTHQVHLEGAVSVVTLHIHTGRVPDCSSVDC